jgi:hypothetical protein
MKLSDRLRRYANEALDNAATASSDEAKRVYLENAGAWMRLAEAYDDLPPGGVSDAFDDPTIADVAA